MIIDQRLQEIWSGHKSVTDGLMDGQTEGRGHSYNPLSASRWGINDDLVKKTSISIKSG